MVDTFEPTSLSHRRTQKPNNNAFKSILNNANELEVNDIVSAVKSALLDLTELEITTWVPESSIQDGDELQNKVQTPKAGNRIHTVINLIDGDITNEIGSQYVGNGPYAELREFHLTQVKESREIISKNIECVHKIYRILIELHKFRKSSQQSNPRI
ncbi:hypothetical protein [Anabaena sp. CA = ATCC 33047]|uniref:hypothetical protein n=1 Tax=Anabaena sp. (strain CA / ATCC 33047) TaxID=52271 RepID=UPI0008361EA7|nr:hypothetical protein [Anabaena sp. CA = ATCC 33047]